MELIDKVKQFIRDLIASMQMSQLYSTTHPIFKNSVDKAYESIREVLKERDKLVIGIISGEFAFEKEIFFELSNSTLARKTIIFFQGKGIERIIFFQYLGKEELYMFVSFLVDSLKEQIRMDLADYLITLGIKNIAVGEIKVSDAMPKEEGESIDYLGIYEGYAKAFSEYVQALLNNKAADFSTLRIAMADVLEHLRLNHQEILKWATVRPQAPAALLHGVNVSILAMYFSFKAEFSKRDILDMGIAALFHDIGKIYLGRKVPENENKLRQEELADIKSHTQWGAEILLKYVDYLGILPALVSFEHHLRYDSKGYPKLSFGYKPHIASLIVSICDVYDAFSERRNAKYGYPADAVYRLMFRGKDNAFDPDLLDIFFKIMGVWPPGTIVSLSDGSVAIVRQENEEDLFCPNVAIVYPQEKKGSIDLMARKREVKIERALNPFTEGKAYLPLV